MANNPRGEIRVVNERGNLEKAGYEWDEPQGAYIAWGSFLMMFGPILLIAYWLTEGIRMNATTTSLIHVACYLGISLFGMWIFAKRWKLRAVVFDAHGKIWLPYGTVQQPKVRYYNDTHDKVASCQASGQFVQIFFINGDVGTITVQKYPLDCHKIAVQLTTALELFRRPTQQIRPAASSPAPMRRVIN